MKETKAMEEWKQENGMIKEEMEKNNRTQSKRHKE